jgi:hypothetical protein
MHTETNTLLRKCRRKLTSLINWMYHCNVGSLGIQVGGYVKRPPPDLNEVDNIQKNGRSVAAAVTVSKEMEPPGRQRIRNQPPHLRRHTFTSKPLFFSRI